MGFPPTMRSFGGGRRAVIREVIRHTSQTPTGLLRFESFGARVQLSAHLFVRIGGGE